MIHTFLPESRSWLINESSATDALPKLSLMSINVGSEPVVMPLILCEVVVGGSANEWKRKEREGFEAVISRATVSTPWW